MKTFFSWFLIVFISGYYVVLTGFYTCEIVLHRYIVQKEKGQEHTIVTLSLTDNEFKSNRVNTKELYLDGKMFDIKKVSFSSGCITIEGFWDNHENELLRHFEKRGIDQWQNKLRKHLSSLSTFICRSSDFIFILLNKKYTIKLFEYIYPVTGLVLSTLLKPPTTFYDYVLNY